MCGIYAILSKSPHGITPTDFSAFYDMSILTQLRGPDSSGMFAVDANKPNSTPKIIKTLGPSTFLPYEKTWDTWKQFAINKASVIVGHGRFATVGKITKKNAHPFTTNHITLVHNGTIESGIDKDHADEVDSAGLCNQIAAKGLDPALETIRGAYAIIVHNAKTGLIHIVKNHERPLSYLENDNGFYIMSERRALDYLYHRSSYIKTGVIRDFYSGRIYTFDPATKSMSDEALKRSFFTHSGTKTSYKTPMVNHVVEPEKPDKHETKYQIGAKIQFKLKTRMQPKGGEKDFIYIGKDEEDNTIFFKSSLANDNLIGKIGVGEFIGATYVASTKTWLYQVKARTIKWEEDEEEDDVLVQDGELIPKKVWRDLCQNETCSLCFERVPETDNEETLVFKSGGEYRMVCQYCLKDSLLQFSERESNKLIQKIMS